jgi:hypothetical protein
MPTVSTTMRRFSIPEAGCSDISDLSRETPTQPEIRWNTWILILGAGLFCGATATLFTLWFFVLWASR